MQWCPSAAELHLLLPKRQSWGQTAPLLTSAARTWVPVKEGGTQSLESCLLGSWGACGQGAYASLNAPQVLQ